MKLFGPLTTLIPLVVPMKVKLLIALVFLSVKWVMKRVRPSLVILIMVKLPKFPLISRPSVGILFLKVKLSKFRRRRTRLLKLQALTRVRKLLFRLSRRPLLVPFKKWRRPCRRKVTSTIKSPQMVLSVRRWRLADRRTSVY